jgi:hypothetical protein
MGTSCGDHTTPLYPQKLGLTSPTSDGHLVSIVHLRTQGNGVYILFVGKYLVAHGCFLSQHYRFIQHHLVTRCCTGWVTYRLIALTITNRNVILLILIHWALLKCNFLNIYISNKYLEQKLYIKMKHVFYIQYNFSKSLMVFETIKIELNKCSRFIVMYTFPNFL